MMEWKKGCFFTATLPSTPPPSRLLGSFSSRALISVLAGCDKYPVATQCQRVSHPSTQCQPVTRSPTVYHPSIHCQPVTCPPAVSHLSTHCLPVSDPPAYNQSISKLQHSYGADCMPEDRCALTTHCIADCTLGWGHANRQATFAAYTACAAGTPHSPGLTSAGPYK